MRRKLNFKISRDPEFVDATFEGEIRDRKFFVVDPQCSIFLSFLQVICDFTAGAWGKKF